MSDSSQKSGIKTGKTGNPETGSGKSGLLKRMNELEQREAGLLEALAVLQKIQFDLYGEMSFDDLGNPPISGAFGNLGNRQRLFLEQENPPIPGALEVTGITGVSG